MSICCLHWLRGRISSKCTSYQGKIFQAVLTLRLLIPFCSYNSIQLSSLEGYNSSCRLQTHILSIYLFWNHRACYTLLFDHLHKWLWHISQRVSYIVEGEKCYNKRVSSGVWTRAVLSLLLCLIELLMTLIGNLFTFLLMLAY